MDINEDIVNFSKRYFNVEVDVLINAIKTSLSAQGYILGAISELILKDFFVSKGYEVKRIKEKPKGGAKGKSAEARGDLYIKKPEDKKWLVIECKGLKSNSEFSYSRRRLLDNKGGLEQFLIAHAIRGHCKNTKVYISATKTYMKSRQEWQRKNKGKRFPPFQWSQDWPGPCNCRLEKIWKDEISLNKWISSLDIKRFSEESYRKQQGPIVILETHAPSKRTGAITGINQAGPLVYDFSIMAVDLFIKTGKHEFVFMNPNAMNHSPSSPEHLYQNYIIDILIPSIKDHPTIKPPWYTSFDEVLKTNPPERDIDYSQVDDRKYERLGENLLDINTDVS